MNNDDAAPINRFNNEMDMNAVLSKEYKQHLQALMYACVSDAYTRGAAGEKRRPSEKPKK